MESHNSGVHIEIISVSYIVIYIVGFITYTLIISLFTDIVIPVIYFISIDKDF